MLWIILGLGAGAGFFIAGIVTAHKHKKCKPIKGFYDIYSCRHGDKDAFLPLIGLAAFVGIPMLGNYIGATALIEAPKQIAHTSSLRALSTAESTTGQLSGNPFYVSATVGDETSYRYYREDTAGRIFMESTSSSSAFLVEDGKQELVTYTCQRPIRDSYWLTLVKDGGDCDPAMTEIHIPEGAVSNNFETGIPR